MLNNVYLFSKALAPDAKALAEMVKMLGGVSPAPWRLDFFRASERRRCCTPQSTATDFSLFFAAAATLDRGDPFTTCLSTAAPNSFSLPNRSAKWNPT